MTLAPPEDADLRWYFNDASAAVGFSSSFDPLCAIAQSGPSDGSGSGRSPDGKMVRVLDMSSKPARRLRALDEAWSKMTAEHRAVLRQAYDKERTRQHRHMRKLGHWPGVLAELNSVKEQYAQAMAKAQAAHENTIGPPVYVSQRTEQRVVDGEEGREVKTSSEAVLMVTRNKPVHVAMPSVVDWLLATKGPRIDSSRLRCSATTDVQCSIIVLGQTQNVDWRCAIHAATIAVNQAWQAWDVARHRALKAHGIVKGVRTPRDFVFRRDE
jgi:plasmid stability protein